MKLTSMTLGLALALGAAPLALADIAPSISIPTGGEAVQTVPPDSKVKIVPKDVRKANREARKAAQAKKDDGSRSGTESGVGSRSKTISPAQDTQVPVTVTPDVSTPPAP